MKEKNEVPDIFDIDEHRLDKEWLSQSSLYFEWSKKLADAKEAFERAKAMRDLVKAELYQKIRSKPEEYELAKATETALEQLITLQDDYQNANNAVIKAKHTVDVYQAYVEGIDSRKKALENLVHLYISGWFADPRPPKGATRDDVDKVTHPKNSRAYAKEK